MSDTMTLNITPGCDVCGPRSGVLVVTSADGLCTEHRRQKHDTKNCAGCGISYEEQSGWYVPTFSSYIDVSYYCPDCISKYQSEYVYKNKRLAEIPVQMRDLRHRLTKYKYDCKGTRALWLRLDELERERQLCFAGSGFNPQPTEAAKA